MADEATPVPTPPQPAPAAAGPPPAAVMPGPGPRNYGPPRPGAPRPGNRPNFKDRPPRDQQQDQPPFPPPPKPKDFSEKPSKRLLDQQIMAELDAALAGFDALGPINHAPPRSATPAATTGSRKKGRIVSIHGKDVFVDVPGGRGQGVLMMDQFYDKPPVVGEEVEFEIDRYDAANGLVMLTRTGAAQAVTDWASVQYGMTVEAKITGKNKAGSGLTIEVNGIRGFMPMSQADLYRIENPDSLIGTKMNVMVVEVNADDRNLIVSRRAVMEKEREIKAVEFWKTLEVGKVFTNAMVKSVKAFGAFVDLGGADALLPIGELSWARVGTVEEIVKVNQLVDVKVIRIDAESRKITLSLRALHANPWDEFAKNHRPGARVNGTVTRIADFGAFVEIAPGIEGLIHISELSTQRVRRPGDVVKEGQPVEVQIINLDPETRRIALSLKAIQAAGEAAADEAESKEQEADKVAAAEKMAARPANPNLRGGVGGGKPLFGM